MNPGLSPLVDTFGRTHSYLRISVTDRCDLRCRYCMPPEGIELQPRAQLLTLEEIGRLTRLFARLGVTKLRLTGGEPMVRKGILGLMHELGRIPGISELGLTTNGVRLSTCLDEALEAGLTHLNLSLDSWRPDRYAELALRNQFDAVQRSLELALRSPLRSLKLNCVMMRGVNDDELLDFVEFTRENRISVRFIEYMPFSGNGWDFSKLFPTHEILERIRARYPVERLPPGSANETAVVYRVPGHQGTLGFISSMTDHFCATCNRLRLTSDGFIKNCLFDHGELSLRDPLRAGASDAELEALIRTSIDRKHARHGGHESPEAIAADPGRSMIQIGG